MKLYRSFRRFLAIDCAVIFLRHTIENVRDFGYTVIIGNVS